MPTAFGTISPKIKTIIVDKTDTPPAVCKLNNNVSITLVRRNNEHIIPALDRVIKRKSLVYKEEKEPQLKS